MMALSGICILLVCLFSSVSPLVGATLPHQHPNPEAVVQEVHRRINGSISRKMLGVQEKTQSCLTGNPIDDCWRCDPDWKTNRQKLAECGIGFGIDALGGKGGEIYLVTDPSDEDMMNPAPGTLRHAVIQSDPLWIVFKSDMEIKLKSELLVNSFKTIDGRGAVVDITGDGCITIQDVSNVIIHNILVHHCKPSSETEMRTSPTKTGHRSKSDGDGISISGSRKIWIDHCSLSYCTDGLIDVKLASTGITISNNHFSNHDKVMLLGASDDDLLDVGMQVTVAFNHFGEKVVQRMPRCRHGFFHIVNNDYTQWGSYAIGGSANPTINSQGNRFTAKDAKEVTAREEATKDEWIKWNWRSQGDLMLNGAFFLPSGNPSSSRFDKASSFEPKSVNLIDQLTIKAGALVNSRGSGSGSGSGSGNGTGSGSGNIPQNPGSNCPPGAPTNGSESTGGLDSWIIVGSRSAPPPSSTSSVVLSLVISLIFYIITNYGGLL